MSHSKSSATGMPTTLRNDLNVIQAWIESHSRVLDLGCGDGSLLENK
jgi:2-polyprenyl-3-methyl-5-hydroxy-6-metoxy-1,4-benzoquinol methylase